MKIKDKKILKAAGGGAKTRQKTKTSFQNRNSNVNSLLPVKKNRSQKIIEFTS